jgi:uncharacterized membrane protein YuzA (DUF378 family)
MRHHRRSFLRGGMYHIGLIIVCFSAFNWGVLNLSGINILGRVFAGVTIPDVVTAAILAISAIVVLWNNWVD